MAEKSEWQGRVGKEWSKRMDGLDRMLGPVGDIGIDALGEVDGMRLLDVGCGAGSTSRALARKGADVTGVDVSGDLLAVAKSAGGDVEYILADAGADPLGGPYEAVYSRCGAMFFDDAIAGWSHIHQATVPGGKLSIVCWCAAKENGWATIPLKAARPIMGGQSSSPAIAGTPGPFAWADPAFFGPILEKSGWKNLKWDVVESDAEMTTGNDPNPITRAVQFSLRIGPLARSLAGAEPEVRAEIGVALARAFRDYLDEDDTVRVPTKAWIITGNA